jgi:hypothetical protein
VTVLGDLSLFVGGELTRYAGSGFTYGGAYEVFAGVNLADAAGSQDVLRPLLTAVLPTVRLAAPDPGAVEKSPPAGRDPIDGVNLWSLEPAAQVK